MSAQALRPWAPPARRKAEPAPRLASRLPAADLAFCAEFAVHGGVAESADGFSNEHTLLRLQQAGLVDLQRETAAPFGITRVMLSPAARALLAGTDRPAAPAAPEGARQPRRHGFEVARGMAGAAVKAELAAWAGAGQPGGTTALERRLLARLDALRVPFDS